MSLHFSFVLELFISQLVASAHLLLREVGEDTVLEIPKPHGQVGTTIIPVPKGAQVISHRIPFENVFNDAWYACRSSLT